MHYHPAPQEPGFTNAYCPEHAPEDEPMDECWSEMHDCVICEEEAVEEATA